MADQFDDMWFRPDLESLLQMAEAAEKHEASRSKRDWLEVKAPGEHFYVVLPSWKQNGPFHKTIFQHWQLGADQKGKTYCPEQSESASGFKCPICHTLALLGQNHVDQQKLRRQRASAATYFNVIPLKWVSDGGLQTLQIDGENTVARILKGPARLADFLYKEARRIPDFFLPNNALPVKVERVEANITTYNVSWSPVGQTGRIPIIKTHEEAELLKKSLADFDRIFSNSWNDEEWAKAVNFSGTLLASHSFKPKDVTYFQGVCPPPNRAKKTKGGGDGTPSPGGSGELKELVVPGAVAVPLQAMPSTAPIPMTPAVVVPPAPVAPVPATLLEAIPTSTQTAAAVIFAAPANVILRDANNINPDTKHPYCYGHQAADPACTSCNYLKTCVIETLTQVQQA